MPLSKEQFQELRNKGLSVEQIVAFEQGKKPATSTAPTPEVLPIPTAPEKSGDGFLKSVAKGVAKLPLRVASSIASPVADRLAGFSGDEVLQRNAEGRNILGMNIKPLGYQASAVQRGDMTLGQGATSMAKDVAGAALEGASYALPVGKAVPIGKGILAGKVGSTIVEGAKAGLKSGVLMGAGTELQDTNSTAGSVAKEAAIGGGIGLLAGGALGPLAVPGAAKNAPKIASEASGSIMQRVARINALDQQKFKQAAGESVGDYLVKRGIYGTDDEIVVKLADRFVKSKQVADEALQQLPGTHKTGVLDDILDELASREGRISTKNVPSRDLQRVAELQAKNQSDGLTMSEINEVKRLYERNVKLGYLKENNTEAVARATNLDDVLRKWQFAKAKELGLQNLDEINRETRLARQLGDALFKKTSRAEGNNAFGLTDAVLISGGDPNAIAMLLTKKTLGSGRVQSAIAKGIAPKPTVGIPEAKFTPAKTTPAPQQSLPTQSIQSLPDTLPPAPPKSSKLPTDSAAGAIMGFQTDENGNITFDPAAAAAGMLAVAGTSKVMRRKEAQAQINRLEAKYRKLTTMPTPRTEAERVRQEHEMKDVMSAIETFSRIRDE